jgi:general secretion pathway protein F
VLSDFAYTCIDSSGQDSKGILSATNRTDAMAQLRIRGLTVVELAEREKKQRREFSLRKGFNDQDVYNMARELSTLHRSGIRIDKAFELLIHSTVKEELKNILTLALADIKAGGSIAQAFEKTGRFNPFMISMIHVGEAVGDLQAAFENVAQYMKFQLQFKAEIRNAMTYPIFLVGASLLTFVFIFNFIVPRFFSIFGTNKAMLPLPAKILYTMSGWFTFTNLGIMALLAVAVYAARKLYPAKIKLPSLQGYLTHIPVVGSLILHLELSRFSYSMYSMLQSGVEFIKALKMSATVIQNKRIQGPVASLVGQIKEGKKIADVFSQVHFLPEIVPNMLRVGEESGSLKEIFFELYQIFDERFKNNIKRVLNLLEPVIIVVMGLMVGFIVITLILTVMSVSSIKL